MKIIIESHSFDLMKMDKLKKSRKILKSLTSNFITLKLSYKSPVTKIKHHLKKRLWSRSLANNLLKRRWEGFEPGSSSCVDSQCCTNELPLHEVDGGWEENMCEEDEEDDDSSGSCCDRGSKLLWSGGMSTSIVTYITDMNRLYVQYVSGQGTLRLDNLLILSNANFCGLERWTKSNSRLWKQINPWILH